VARSVKAWVIVAGILFLYSVICTGVFIRRVRSDSGRLRQLRVELDAAVGELAEDQRRAREFTADIGSGLDELKAGVEDGTRGVSERIRRVAVAVKALEDRVRGYCGGVGGGGGIFGGEEVE